MPDKLESYKKELGIGLNAFNEPLEVSGGSAWAKMIMNLVFMAPGTIPTAPTAGCNIQQFSFSFIDDSRDDITQLIKSQAATFYPEIPLTDVEVTSYNERGGGEPIMLIILTFDGNTDNESITVVAAEKVNSVLNFSIVSDT